MITKKASEMIVPMEPRELAYKYGWSLLELSEQLGIPYETVMRWTASPGSAKRPKKLREHITLFCGAMDKIIAQSLTEK